MGDSSENPLSAGQEFSAGDLALQNFTAGSISEGAGAAGGAYNAVMDAVQGDWGGAAVEAAGVGLDALGMVMNPLSGLASAGIGWLIEHVGFLKEPLDLLAGDPAAVSAHAQTWTNIATALRETADNYEQSLEGVFVGSGNALVAYSEVSRTYTDAVRTAATHADEAASAIHRSGVIVAVTRSIIRDMIADWVADRAYRWLFASATTAVSFGATQAAFIVDSISSGGFVTTSIRNHLVDLVWKLDDFAEAARQSTGAFTRASRSIGELATGVTGQLPRLGAEAVQHGAKGAKEAAVQASNSDERAHAAAEEGTWRMHGSI